MTKNNNNKTAWQTIRLYMDFAHRYKFIFYAPAVLIAVSVIVQNIYWPFVLSRIFDNFQLLDTSRAAFAKQNIFADFKILLGLSLYIFIIWRLITFTFIKCQALVLRDMDEYVYKRLHQNSYKFFADNFAGSLVTQTKRFITGFEDLHDQVFWNYLTMLTRLVASIIVLIFIAPSIGLSMFIWAIFFASSIVFISRKKSKYTLAEAKADSRTTAELADGITNAITVKIFAQDRSEQRRFSKIVNDRMKKRKKSWDLNEWIRAYQSILMLALELFVLWTSIQGVVSGRFSVGVVLLVQLYLSRVFSDLWELGRYIEQTERSLSHANEMTKILMSDVDVKDDNKFLRADFKHGEIEFRDVSFSYEKSHAKVFEGLNIQIKAGEKIGLVGPSGGGKTTLTKLLLRFLDIDGGSISIDSIDISKVLQSDLRRQIAYVPQEPILFHRNLMENIKYGCPGATDAEAKEASRLAHAAEFIEKLPEGYDTLVGERGMKLSGGQKQRVAIARAMLVKAPILLLDEATSALDSKSEKLISEALDNLMKGRTTVVIAHRLSTIRKLDRIIVMKDGQAIEQGKHDELLEKKGVYAELWGHQSGDFLDD